MLTSVRNFRFTYMRSLGVGIFLQVGTLRFGVTPAMYVLDHLFDEGIMGEAIPKGA